MDRASQVLAQGRAPDVPRRYAALAERGDVPLSTLHHGAHGRRSKEQKAQSQHVHVDQSHLFQMPYPSYQDCFYANGMDVCTPLIKIRGR